MGDNIKTNIENKMGARGMEWSGLGQGQMAGFCEQSSETGGSIKCKGYVEELRKC